MTTLNVKVGAGADDAYERDNGTSFSGTASQLRSHSDALANNRHNSGMRFNNVTVPNAATINSATLKIWGTFAGSDNVNCELLCEDVDDAANFTDTADVTSRARTAVGATWIEDSIGTGGSISPDFKSAPQTVVNRAGWSSGADMVAFLDGKSNIAKVIFFDSYEGDSTEAAELDALPTPAAVSVRVPSGSASE